MHQYKRTICMKQGLKRGLVVVFAANVVNLVISLLSGFIIPKNLSVETYAAIKTFQLYASYVGVLHFGFVDGIYLKYGGRSLDEIGVSSVQRSLSTLRIFQLIISALGVIAGLVTKNIILAVFGLYIMPTNILFFFQYMYQAVGEFDSYSRIIYATNILRFAINLFLIFIIRTDAAYLYLLVFFVVEFILWVVTETLFIRKTNNRPTLFEFSLTDFREYTRSGISLTLGNLSSLFLTGMDQWFTKFLLDTVAFAQYSFAVSMENLLNVAISPISVILYNYFCNEKDETRIRHIRNSIQVFAAFLVACAFPARFILEVYLQKYLDSIKVMFLLFGAQMFYVVIKGVYINLYKAHKEQDKYFTRLLWVIVIGFVFNVLFYLIYRGKEAFAVGTLSSAFVWFLLCVYDNRSVGFNIREFLYLIIQEFAFIACGMMFSAVIGFAVYLTVTVALSWLLLGEDFRFLIETGKSMLSNTLSGRRNG